jgi:hypothetical protein
MSPGAIDVDSPRDVSAAPALRRERVVVRRRRSRSRRRSDTWTAPRSPRRIVHVLLVCAAALVLMAAGIYFGLSAT